MIYSEAVALRLHQPLPESMVFHVFQFCQYTIGYSNFYLYFHLYLYTHRIAKICHIRYPHLHLHISFLRDFSFEHMFSFLVTTLFSLLHPECFTAWLSTPLLFIKFIYRHVLFLSLSLAPLHDPITAYESHTKFPSLPQLLTCRRLFVPSSMLCSFLHCTYTRAVMAFVGLFFFIYTSNFPCYILK